MEELVHGLKDCGVAVQMQDPLVLCLIEGEQFGVTVGPCAYQMNQRSECSRSRPKLALLDSRSSFAG